MTKTTKIDDTTTLNPTRRKLLQGGLTASTAVLIPLVNTACTPTKLPPPSSVLGAENEATLAAFADRIFPRDELGPAASRLGVITYINRSLKEWNQAEVPVLAAGLAALNRAAFTHYGRAFTLLTAEQQDSLLLALEAGELSEITPGAAFFNRLHRLVMEGMFSDPYYGGNANYAGWDLIGYPGAVLASVAEMQTMGQRLPSLRTSAYGAEHDGH